MDIANAGRNRPALILGGTGKTGRRVAHRLQRLGHAVRVGSRAGSPPFDWQVPSTWTPALRGAGALYLSYFPDVAIPGAVNAIRALVDEAHQAGIERVVFLSGRGEEEAERAEDIVRSCGIPWTIVRAAWFCQNFNEGFLRDAVVAGEVVLPLTSVGEPFVDADDVADVAVAALTDDLHSGQLYEVTGPRLLTFEQAVDEIGIAAGREIRYVPVSAQRHHALMQQQGVPDDITWLIDYLFCTVLDGRNAHVADGVQRALGRPPRDFRQFAQRAAAAGAWTSGIAAQG
jgi:uncharacterized protein YbjT (DUF2867 family)